MLDRGEEVHVFGSVNCDTTGGVVDVNCIHGFDLDAYISDGSTCFVPCLPLVCFFGFNDRLEVFEKCMFEGFEEAGRAVEAYLASLLVVHYL